MKELYKGYEIQIQQDEDAESPRQWDNLGTMICFHKRYDLGDKHNYETHEDFLVEHPATGGKTFILPLFLYEHGGITISTKPYNDRWDSGQVGFIYMDVEAARKEFPNRKDWKKLKAHVYKILESEVKVYDQYLTGDVYGYAIEELEESCWGFYGKDEARKEAKKQIDYEVVENQKRKEKKLKAYIQNNVPYEHRTL